MQRRIAGVIVLAAVTAAGLGRAQTKPNFSGTWVAVSGAKEAIGQEIQIRQDATSITLGHGGETEHSETFRLDGKEVTQPDLAHPSESNVTQAMWDGDKVVIKVKFTNGTTHTRTLTMQSDGTMLLEVSAMIGGKAETIKAVHKKK